MRGSLGKLLMEDMDVCQSAFAAHEDSELDESILLEMNVPEALELLGLSGSDLGDHDKIKKVYRQKAMGAHPDRGGNEDQMKLINHAYDILSKAPAGSYTSPADRDATYKANQQNAKEAAAIALATIEKTIDLKHFNQHIEHATGKTFKFTVKAKVTNWYDAVYDVDFVSDDKLTTFDMQISARGGDIAFGNKSASLGGHGAEHVSFSIDVFTQVFHNNRKVKLASKSWVITNDHKTIIDPEVLFPSAKLKKMVGSEAKDKARAFQKRDMLLSLEKRLNGRVWSGKDITVSIPIGDMFMLVYRSTGFNRGQSFWGINGLYSSTNGGKRSSSLYTVFMPESEAAIEHLVHIQRGAQDKTGDQLVSYINAELKKIHDTQKVESAIFRTMRDEVAYCQRVLSECWKGPNA